MRKTIILMLFFAIPLLCVSQSKTQEVIQESTRGFYKNSMDVIVKSSDKAMYNFYYKGDRFYWEVEVDMMISEEDFKDAETKRLLKNGSYRYSYHMAEKFLSFTKKEKKVFSKTDTEYIYINIYYTKSDLSRIEYLYYIKPNDLWEISSYLNKNDFIEILSERLH